MKDKNKNKNHLYLYFVLPQELCRVKLVLEQQEGEEGKPPPIEKLLYFPDKDLPAGMGAFALDSKLYLLGGEILKKGQRLDPIYSVSPPHIFEALSNQMFLLNHPYPKGPIIEPISSMEAPKPSPQVAIVDGKLYVFAGKQHCYRKVPPSPMFECYDPTTGLWDSLPDPPCYFPYQPTHYFYVSVLGRQIIVRSQMGVWFYDVVDRTWKGSRYIENNPFVLLGRVADKSDNDVVVVYTIRGVVAYKDASLGREQVLKDLNSCLPPPHDANQVTFISYLGENRFCLFLSEICSGDNGDWMMHVITFRLERLPQEEEEQTHEGKGEREGEQEKNFCRVFVFRHHKYNASEDITDEQSIVTHAFTMVSSADGGSSRTLQKPIQTSADLDAKTLSKSANKNLKKKMAKGRNTEASSSAEDVNQAAVAGTVASQMEGLTISSNPSTVIDVPNSSTLRNRGLPPLDERIEELKRKIRVLVDEKQVKTCDELYNELILLENERWSRYWN